LSEIADSFARLVEASGEGAGKAVGDAMKGALDASLRQAGQAIEGIATELRELPAHFNSAAASIQNAGSAVAKQQEELAAEIRDALKVMLSDAGSQISSNIDQGTRNLLDGLKNSGSAFDESATKISAFFERFSSSGEDYLTSLASLSSQNAKLEVNLAAISSQIAASAESVARASSAVDGNLDRLLTGIGDVTRVAADASRTARESQEAIRGVVETLQQQMSQHLQRFNTVDEKLATVFSSIGSHLELQSKQMGEQLTTMDQALARAVNQFELLIDDLTEAMTKRQAAE
jgi:predicted  nucleic acid-binding Zn-ribbon protein